MIPVHRQDVHLKKYALHVSPQRNPNPLNRLLSQGYKVGIVEQIETAALKKVSDTRNAPFEREVTRLYTAAT